MKTIKLTFLNIVYYAFSLGKFIFLEGRIGENGIVSNWNKNLNFKPNKFCEPESIDEIIKIINRESKVRVIGAGHSFNKGIETDFLISLDKFTGIIRFDEDKKEVKVRGGTRVRDISVYLWKLGYALEYLPSHDAQSIAGIISTDVHGTGKKVSFVSDQVLSIELVDGNGTLHSFDNGTDGFNAAIGGIGTCGIIVTVTLNVVKKFRIRKEIKTISVDEFQTNLKQSIIKNDHYRVIWNSYSNECVEYTFNRAEEPLTPHNRLREFWTHLVLTFYSGILTEIAGKDSIIIKIAQKLGSPNKSIVMRSFDGFNQSLYHPHVEIEFTLDRKEIWHIFDEIRDIFKNANYKFFYALEFRFTEEHLIGFVSPGYGKNEKVYIDILINNHKENAPVYKAINNMIIQNKLKPHLGKFTIDIDSTYMKQCYGQNFKKMVTMQKTHDPQQKFMNAFCKNIF